MAGDSRPLRRSPRSVGSVGSRPRASCFETSPAPRTSTATAPVSRSASTRCSSGTWIRPDAGGRNSPLTITATWRSTRSRSVMASAVPWRSQSATCAPWTWLTTRPSGTRSVKADVPPRRTSIVTRAVTSAVSSPRPTTCWSRPRRRAGSDTPFVSRCRDQDRPSACPGAACAITRRADDAPARSMIVPPLATIATSARGTVSVARTSPPVAGGSWMSRCRRSRRSARPRRA